MRGVFFELLSQHQENRAVLRGGYNHTHFGLQTLALLCLFFLSLVFVFCKRLDCKLCLILFARVVLELYKAVSFGLNFLSQWLVLAIKGCEKLFPIRDIKKI